MFIPVNHFTFEIVEGNEEKKFRIDPSARTILVNKALDYDYPVMDRNVSLVEEGLRKTDSRTFWNPGQLRGERMQMKDMRE